MCDSSAKWPVKTGNDLPPRAPGNFFMNLDAPTAAWNITLRGVRASDVLTPSIHLAPTGASAVLASGNGSPILLGSPSIAPRVTELPAKEYC